MTVEQHLQQLIGTLAIQLAQKDAELDKLRIEIDTLSKNQRKPKKVNTDDPS